MSQALHEVLEQLPTGGLTVTLLGALDYIVPGEWENITTLERMCAVVTGETDDSLIQTVGERAVALYADESNQYQRAVWLYSAIDSVDKLGGLASLGHKLGEKVSFLSFLDSITPSADTTQAIDAGLKFAGELAGFCLVNGIPGDSIGDFAGSLGAYAKEDMIRLAAWIAFDCVLPLGPDFLGKIMDKVSSVGDDDLLGHGVFQKIASFLPGDVANQRTLITGALDSASSTIQGIVDQRGITQDSLFDRVRGYVDVGDNGLDYVAAAIDMGTSYYEHTGAQSVARRIVSRAYGEI